MPYFSHFLMAVAAVLVVHAAVRHLAPGSRGTAAFAVAPQLPWPLVWTALFGAGFVCSGALLAGILLSYNPGLAKTIVAAYVVLGLATSVTCTRIYTARCAHFHFVFKRDNSSQISVHAKTTKAGRALAKNEAVQRCLAEFTAALPSRTDLPRSVVELIFDSPWFGGSKHTRAQMLLERVARVKYPDAQIVGIDRTMGAVETFLIRKCSRHAVEWFKTSGDSGPMSSGGFRVVFPIK